MKNNILTLALALVVSSANAGTSSSKQPTMPPPAPPAPACNDLSYNFFEATYVHNFGENDTDTDGYALTLSSTIVGNLFGFAEFNQGFGDSDFISADAGLGYHVPLTSCIDFVVKAAIVYDDYDNSDSEIWSGLGGVGFRIGLAKWLELDLFYHAFWDDFDKVESSGSLALIFREVIAPKVDIIIDGVVGENSQGLSAGFRYNF